ncbi:hypothetical protein ACRAKI_00265 [Saccharothrix isguenensis]
MNLRKTLAGAAVALGGAAVMLGLGGTAQAADIGAETRPQLDTEPGKIATIGDVAGIDTRDLAGRIGTKDLLDRVRTVDLDLTDPETTVEGLADSAQGATRDRTDQLPTVETGVSFGS